MKKIFKLAISSGNYKAINGWKSNNENLYNTLTHSEKKRVNEIMVKQLEEFLPHERMSFDMIVNLVRPLTDEQLEMLCEKNLLSIIIDR